MTNFRNIIGILANGEACGSAQKEPRLSKSKRLFFVYDNFKYYFAILEYPEAPVAYRRLQLPRYIEL